MLLIGAAPPPITAPAVVIASYVVGALLVVVALAAVLLQEAWRSVAALALAFSLMAFISVLLGPPGARWLALGEVAVFLSLSAGIYIYAQRRIPAAGPSPPRFHQLLPAAAVSLALLLLLGEAELGTPWTGRTTAGILGSFGHALSSTFLIQTGIAVVLLAGGAAGARALIAKEMRPGSVATEPAPRRSRRRGRRGGRGS